MGGDTPLYLEYDKFNNIRQADVRFKWTRINSAEEIKQRLKQLKGIAAPSVKITILVEENNDTFIDFLRDFPR